jgi:hypothetical protein
MIDFTPIQKLDTVLYILNLNSKNIGGIRVYLLDNYLTNLTIAEVLRIAKRLEKDGYIIIENQDLCLITFDGELFLQQGGYQAKSLADASNVEEQMLEIARLKSVDVSSDQNQRTLNTLTNRLSWATWFAFGAAIALLCWQIFSYYHPAAIPVNVKIQTQKKP